MTTNAAKTPLVLLPGLLCDERLWRHQVEHLRDIADIVVAELTESDSMNGMARSVLEQSPERFALAGLSMGGYVAQEVMRAAPERVTHLALLDTSARADTPEQTQARRKLVKLARDGRFEEVPRALLPKLLHPRNLDDDALVPEILDMARAVGPDAFERQEEAIIGRRDGREDLGAITCPTLVLCGGEDALTPLHLHEEMADAIPGARLRVIEGAGHLATLERPEEVTAALRDWLEA